MNPIQVFTDKEINNFKEAGINFENRIYNKEEIKRIDYQTRDYIMSLSTKNRCIENTLNKFKNSLQKLERYE